MIRITTQAAGFARSRSSLGWLLLFLTAHGFAASNGVTELRQRDFRYGTVIIDTPGTYRLAEDIRFRPNSPRHLTRAIERGLIPQELASHLGLPIGSRVPAHKATAPLPTQLLRGARDAAFSPGGPLDARYDPAAFGLGFFAAIVITADDVVLDLNGHRLEQSHEHALMQRFFSLIELASAPFIPAQGPHDFGSGFKAAQRVTIKNGTLGRSAHHGIHGNDNRAITLRNLTFDGFEVAAVALNGVRGLRVHNVTAKNRKGVPVLGTFSSAQFIKPYLEDLVRNGSAVTLTVQGQPLSAADALAQLTTLIDRVHGDIVYRRSGGQRRMIDPATHPEAYGLFHNAPGLVDGNGYGFLLNPLGVAVNGFPTTEQEDAANGFLFHNVHIERLHGFINEVVALNSGTGATIDPIGAVWQLFNTHPDTGAPLTVSEIGLNARYLGNPVANAQALVAKAIHAGDFDQSPLSVGRSSITPAMVRWVEAQAGYETLAAVLPTDQPYLCNGDSMFHVNKGMVGFKIDGARYGVLANTSVRNARNFGKPGTDLCGDYSKSLSHPLAELPGYGGARLRGYSFAGSKRVTAVHATVQNAATLAGDVSAFDAHTDSDRILLIGATARRLTAGEATSSGVQVPNTVPLAAGVRIGRDAGRVRVVDFCARRMVGAGGAETFVDDTGVARVSGGCR